MLCLHKRCKLFKCNNGQARGISNFKAFKTNPNDIINRQLNFNSNCIFSSLIRLEEK